MQLSDPGLMKDRCYLGGEWVAADSGETIPVTNPATGEVLGDVPRMGAAETARAIDAAAAAWPAWRARTAKDRSAVLRRWSDLMLANQDDLGALMTLEQGKPLAEAKGEVAYAASFIEWFAEEARRVYGDTIPAPNPDWRIVVTREPVGVTAAVTPWNFPAAMITRKAGPALAAGCPMVVKPATATPLSALALAELAERAGVPAGVFSVITGKSAEIGREMTSNPVVRKFSFTGSTEIGKQLMEQCAGTVKKVSLELGGNAPFIVFDDADLEAAVAGAVASKYRNMGQTCVCANRVLVQDGVYEEFSARLGQAVSAMKVGNGLDAGVVQGPLIDMAAVEKVEEHIADALDNGARVVVGGNRHPLGGTWFEPTVLADVTPDMKVAREETFGPVAPLFRFEGEGEAVTMANDTEFGLASYFYSRDIGRIWRVSEGLEYGMVGVNSGILSAAEAPVRRGQGVRDRPRGLLPGPRRVPRDQVPLHGRRLRLSGSGRPRQVPRSAASVGAGVGVGGGDGGGEAAAGEARGDRVARGDLAGVAHDAAVSVDDRVAPLEGPVRAHRVQGAGELAHARGGSRLSLVHGGPDPPLQDLDLRTEPPRVGPDPIQPVEEGGHSAPGLLAPPVEGDGGAAPELVGALGEVLDPEERVAEPPSLELERGPPPLGVRRRRAPRASRDRGEPLDELASVRRGALGRGGRGRRPLVRHEVCDRHVRLVPDAGDDRNGAGVHGPGHPLLVERPEVLEGAAAPHHEEDVALRATYRDADGARDLLSRAFPLHPGRVDHHRQRREPAPQHLEHVVHRRAARRGDHPELARKGGKGPLVPRIEETLLLELEAQALVGEPERAFARRLELLDDELKVPAGAVQARRGHARSPACRPAARTGGASGSSGRARSAPGPGSP